MTRMGHGAVRPLDPPPHDDYDPYKFLSRAETEFVKRYIVHFNGRKAATEAGYSAKSAHVQASLLLNRYDVSYAIQKEIAARNQRIELTADMVVRELGWLALSDYMNYEIDDDGFVQAAEGAPSEVTRAIKSIKRRVWWDDEGNKHIETEFTLHDKLTALKMLSQHLGMLIERHAHEHSGPGGGPVVHQHWVVGGREIHF